MFGSSIVDIAIGIVFVFFLLSLMTSTINEIILSFFNMRGRYLLDGLKTLLDDDHTHLVSQLYNHGQIFGLFKGNFNPRKKGNLPSYIPSQNFATAFLDVVAPEKAGVQKLASLTSVATTWADGDSEKVGKPLLAMVNAAGNDSHSLDKITKGIEDWYNSAMERVSGWYKYRTQWCLFGIGLVLAVALNADTVRIVKQLSNDSTMRQSIIAAAQSVKAPENNPAPTINEQIQQVHKQVSQIENLGIPLGWAGAWVPSSPLGSGPWLWGWLTICGGWLLTAVAVSLGAPFWFDLLNKITIVRSTLKPQEKRAEEVAKESEATAATLALRKTA